LATRWPRETVEDCAARLSLSREAAELFAACDVIDLHVDSYIWHRVLRYRLDRRHGRGLFGGRYYSQVDFPRLRQVGVTGATWVITTNPMRSERGRARALLSNLESLEALLDAHPEDVRRVTTVAEYRAASAAGLHAAFIGVQGGNAIAENLEPLAALQPERLLRVTLTHLSSSWLGETSSPAGRRDGGLGANAGDLIALLNERRILVDLAHINRRGFFEALERHSRDVPPIVTHTGVSGVRPHWRNLDDEQLRAIAERDGTVGIMYHTPFLAPGLRRKTLDCVADHILHVIRTVGDEYVSLGSDWDGAIVTPRDMPTCLELPRLVDTLLGRGLSATAIEKLLGGNFLRVLGRLRG
jgi:membrane dipeptidase